MGQMYSRKSVRRFDRCTSILIYPPRTEIEQVSSRRQSNKQKRTSLGSFIYNAPPELTLEVTVGYEDNFLASYAGDHDEAVATIEATLTHAQAFFYAESLQTKITLRTNGDITYWPDQRMTAKENFMKQFATLLRANTDTRQCT